MWHGRSSVLPLLPLVLAACVAGDAPSVEDQPLPALCVTAPEPVPFPGTDACPAPVPAMADGLDAALAVAGLTRCDVKIPPAADRLSGFPAGSGDAQRLPEYDALQGGPLRLPGWARRGGEALSAALDGPAPAAGAIAMAAQRRGVPAEQLSGCLDGARYRGVLGKEAPLARALAVLLANRGATADLAALAHGLHEVPDEVQRALVPLVAAVDGAYSTVLEARGAADEDTMGWLAQNAPRLLLNGVSLTQSRLGQLRAVQVGPMARAAALLSLAVHGLGPLPAARFAPITIETPIGKILLRDAGDDVYEALAPGETVALIVDLGGNDRYFMPAGAADVGQPVSVVVDLGGDDSYEYETKKDASDAPGRLPADGAGRQGGGGRGRTLSRVGRQGSGTLGVGLLFDLGGGRDRYRSLALSQGAGILGVGVLYDDGGDDDYRAEAASQGAAAWGLGLLLDRGGRDQYRSYSYSQGFGYTGGVGVLADGDGDDLYFVNPGDPQIKADPELPAVGGNPMYASAQLPTSGNNSMSQGCGFGRRADNLPDGLFMAGGLGVLYDRRGSDRYLASVFAQGCGYYRGVGLLLDGEGDDQYEGLWYVQGAAAHVAIGAFFDLSGADRYDETFPIRATSIGTSNDFSVGLHADLGGDDRYRAPGLSLGSGYAQGFGLLLNVGGADRYEAAGYPTLGGATISGEFPYTVPRAAAPTLGLFADLGGQDSYVVPTVNGFTLGAGDDRKWSFAQILRDNPMGDVPKSEKSCGLDDGAATAVLP